MGQLLHRLPHWLLELVPAWAAHVLHGHTFSEVVLRPARCCGRATGCLLPCLPMKPGTPVLLLNPPTLTICLWLLAWSLVVALP